jgi:hypothetical protein
MMRSEQRIWRTEPVQTIEKPRLSSRTTPHRYTRTSTHRLCLPNILNHIGSSDEQPLRHAIIFIQEVAMLAQMTLPTTDDITRVLQSSPIHTYSPDDVSRYLRQLHGTYPNSQLIVSVPVDIVETSCHDGSRHHIRGHIAIIEQLDATREDGRFLLDLLGGTTGHEGFYLPSTYAYLDWGQSGWSACAGTPGSWNASYVPPNSMMAVGVQFLPRFLSGERISFPPPLTQEERTERLEAARRRFLSGLRRQQDHGLAELETTCLDPAPQGSHPSTRS